MVDLADVKYLTKEPFAFQNIGYEVDKLHLVIRLANDLAKPISPNEAEIEYLPTYPILDDFRQGLWIRRNVVSKRHGDGIKRCPLFPSKGYAGRRVTFHNRACDVFFQEIEQRVEPVTIRLRTPSDEAGSPP